MNPILQYLTIRNIAVSLVIIAITFPPIIPFVLILFSSSDNVNWNEISGQYGDAFGALNSVASLLALVFLAMAYNQQQNAFADQRQSAKEQIDELSRQKELLREQIDEMRLSLGLETVRILAEKINNDINAFEYRNYRGQEGVTKAFYELRRLFMMHEQGLPSACGEIAELVNRLFAAIEASVLIEKKNEATRHLLRAFIPSHLYLIVKILCLTSARTTVDERVLKVVEKFNQIPDWVWIGQDRHDSGIVG